MLLDKKVRSQLDQKFKAELKRDVDIKMFSSAIISNPTGTDNREYVQFTHDFLKELTEVSSKIKVEFLDMYGKEAKDLGVNVSPSVFIGHDMGYSIQYWGAPAGYEASGFIETISMVSRGESGLTTSSREKLSNIDRDTVLEVYITPNCPHCPKAVLLANQLAVESPGKMTSRCIEAQEVMDRARTFGVSSVPQQVINEDMGSITIGVQPETKFVNQVLQHGSSRAESILKNEEEKKNKTERLEDNPGYPVTLTDETLDKAVAKYPFLVVDCWAEWCGPCRMVGPIIEKLAKDHQGDIIFGKLDVDSNPASATKFGIRSIPNLLVFKDGKKAGDIIGAMPERPLLEKIRAYK